MFSDVPINTIRLMRAMKPMRQIEAALLMIAMNRFSVSYARSLVAGSPDSQIVEGRRRPLPGLTADQTARMQRESENLEREFRIAEARYSAISAGTTGDAVGWDGSIAGREWR